MADTVTTQTIADTSGVKFVAKLTNLSDGSGETLVKKVDASELTFMSEDGNRSIARVYYSINTSDRKSGGVEVGPKIFTHSQSHHKPEIIKGINQEICSNLLKNFFKMRR